MTNTEINRVFTAQPVQTGNPADYRQEWGRTPDVERVFGIKRGTLYNLYADGKIDGRELRVRGQLKGVRLWNMDSIRRFIEEQPYSFGDADNIDEKAPLFGRGNSDCLSVSA